MLYIYKVRKKSFSSRLCIGRIIFDIFPSGPLVLAPSSDADARRYVQLAKLPGWELVVEEEEDVYGKDEL